MEKEGGEVEVGGGEKEWQTKSGKINTNVVSSWVLMSTTHRHLRKKYKWAERKNEERERCKILTASATPPSATPTVTA